MQTSSSFLTKDALITTLNDGKTAYLSAIECGDCGEQAFVTYPNIPNFCPGCGSSFHKEASQIRPRIEELISLCKQTAPTTNTSQAMVFLYIAAMLEQSLIKLNSLES